MQMKDVDSAIKTNDANIEALIQDQADLERLMLDYVSSVNCVEALSKQLSVLEQTRSKF